MGLGAGLLLDALLPSVDLPAVVRWSVGALLVLGGLALMATFIGAFRRAETNVDPYKPSTAIVTDGPYGFTRNPGYLGMALVFSGIAFLAEAPWALVLLPPTMAVIDRGVIAREERYLEGKFGEEYLAYKPRVRRWL
jgi:protein-S-isoprenylcysteine O-methyltransferase Ste14